MIAAPVALRIPIGEFEPARPLTPMQARIVDLIIDHQDYKALGRALGIAPATAKTHVRTIAGLLPGVMPAKQLVLRYAVRRYAILHGRPRT